MSILGLLVALLLVVLAFFAAKSTPPPFNFVIYAVLTLVVVLCLLQAFGVLGSADLNAPVFRHR